VQRSWNEQVAQIREDVESKKTELDVHTAQKRAEHTEDDAAFAVEFAYSAVVEAEYAVLDAVLARMDADEKSEQAGASS
jgi:hypothetical protein